MSLIPGLGKALPGPNPPRYASRLRARVPWTEGYPKEYNAGFFHELLRPHIDSFNFFLTRGLREIERHNQPHVRYIPDRRDHLRVHVTEIEVGAPEVRMSNPTRVIAATPQTCRELAQTYASPVTGRLSVEWGKQRLEQHI